ncbi:bifunctional adenosylcobinamide kinase/adenosylcobinamide-phosphate guanylyltransferase [Gluconacetobacter sp. Hr-1-5]|uniref:bifunctional adenosylcobinamide kinase/adenosylcobinamide-phosphate guanylyltransferase n=1 Tax=Gluconacetobacter sp. Hr-1-5 TaxID=3395370 RepID=UPI003B52F22E
MDLHDESCVALCVRAQEIRRRAGEYRWQQGHCATARWCWRTCDREQPACPASWISIATARAWDAEKQARIARHRDDRAAGRQAVEGPLDLIPTPEVGGPVMAPVDWLSEWLTNLALVERDIASGTGWLNQIMAGMAGMAGRLHGRRCR